MFSSICPFNHYQPQHHSFREYLLSSEKELLYFCQSEATLICIINDCKIHINACIDATEKINKIWRHKANFCCLQTSLFADVGEESEKRLTEMIDEWLGSPVTHILPLNHPHAKQVSCPAADTSFQANKDNMTCVHEKSCDTFPFHALK